MLWARLLAYVTGTRTPVAKRISGGGEPDPERADPGSVAAFGRRKGDTGRDRSPPGSNGTGDVPATAKPDTILRWHRKFLANKFDGSKFRRSIGHSRPAGAQRASHRDARGLDA